MTAAHDAPGPAAAEGSDGGQPSRHQASGSASARNRDLSGRLTALAVVPALIATAAGVLVAAFLIRASSARLLRGSTLIAVLVLAGLALLAIVAAAVWAARVGRAVGRSKIEYVHVPGRVQLAPAVPAAPFAPPTAAADNSVFVHLSHRLQSIVHRQIDLLDRLENDVEEPDLLKGLFGVDHLATRMRRHAENLAVLGGAVPRRQWTKPISVMEVLRSAVSETLDYSRVQVIARSPGALNGYAVAGVIHLLAELVENATTFSPQSTKVMVRTQEVAAGLLIEIDDRGPGMAQREYDRLNAVLAEPAEISVQELLQGARIGLYVVAQLAQRHGIRVQLQSNIAGGTQALVVLPRPLLASEPRAIAPARESAAAPDTAASDSAADTAAPLPARALPAPRLPVDTPAAAEVAVSRSRSTSAEPLPPSSTESVGSDVRPPLPHRRPQQHLATPLTAPTVTAAADRVGENARPTLMADFKRGMARGAVEPSSGEHGGANVPTQEGNT